jgi:hypothetical protein
VHTANIPVRITQTGQTMKVAVYDKRAERITVVLGEDANPVQVQADLDRDNPALRKAGRRRTA